MTQLQQDAAAHALALLTTLRESALSEAELVLTELGFRRDVSSQDWIGPLNIPASKYPMTARVRLPYNFPDALPHVVIDRSTLPRRIAHVEENGKVCIAPTSGILIDAGRPGDLVREALARAEHEIARGISGESDPDIGLEFNAYWQTSGTIYSICSPSREFGVVYLGSVQAFGSTRAHDIVSDSEEEAKRWAANLGTSVSGAGTAIFLPLQLPFDPPDFGAKLSVRDVLSIISNHAAKKDADAFRAQLQWTALPVTLVFSLPESDPDGGRRLVAIRLEKVSADAKKAASRGFRVGHVPSTRELNFSDKSPATQLRLERFDPSYLVRRGGGSTQLRDVHISVVGVGALGSELSSNLAAIGVGALDFIDSDSLSAENVHRHYLGVRHVDKNKAVALSEELASRYPHQRFVSWPNSVEKVLESKPEVLFGADLVVLATGEETLERRLNQLLKDGPMHLHSWVEPLGLAGHALLVIPGTHGCFECLFKSDPILGLENRSALAAPGQEIRRSLGGCSGTFSPFSVLDSRRTALEACALAVRGLTGDVTASTLLTWRGESTDFETEGFELSTRAAVIGSGVRALVAGSDLAQEDCRICGYFDAASPSGPEQSSAESILPPPQSNASNSQGEGEL